MHGLPLLPAGMMELSYTQHYSTTPGHHAAQGRDEGTSSSSSPAAGVDITFTATTNASGTLLIGRGR